MQRYLTIPVLALSMSLGMPTDPVNAQLEPNGRVRFKLADGENGWQSGRLISIGTDTLVMLSDRGESRYALTDVLELQAPAPSGRPLTGVAAGGGIALALALVFGDAAGVGEVAGVTAVGAMIGLGWSAGRQVRLAGAVGMLLGASIGAITFGATGGACESGAGVGCNMFIGGAMIGALGTLAGTAVGLLLPDWRSVSLEGVRFGASMLPGGSFAMSTRLRF